MSAGRARRGRAAGAAAGEHFRPDIQGLRAVAVLLVALGHAGVAHLEGGYIGVDVFFVISGFLITGWLVRHSDASGGVPFREFYAARARRILPNAALVLVVTVVASRNLLNFVRAQSAFHDSIWAAFFAANVRFARVGTNYFATATPPSPVQHYWSLAVEEQFYLVWPALVLAVVFLARRRSVSLRDDYSRLHWPIITARPVDAGATRRLTVVLAVAVAASFAWSVHATSATPAGAYFSTFTRAWELGVGALLALAVTQAARLPAAARAALAWIGLAAVAVAAVTFDSATRFPGYAAALPVLGTAAIVAGGIGAASPFGPRALLGVAPLRFIGDVSYSFYLWHWPVLVIAEQYEGHALTVAQNVGLLAAAFAVSVVTYLAYERPLHRGTVLATPGRGLVVWPVSIAAVLVVALVALHLVQRQIDGQQQAAEVAAATATTIPSSVLTTVPTPTAPGVSTPSTAAPPTTPFTQAVAASVTPQRLAARVPVALSPPVDDLQRGRFNAHGCAASFGQDTTAKICRLGDASAKRRLVVFGDSHAEMWMTALESFAVGHHWALTPMYKEGCVPATFVGGNPQRAGPCKAWYQWALGQVRALHPDAILLGGSYAEGVSVGSNAEADAEQGTFTEITALSPLAPRLVLIGDAPFQEKDPVDCLLAGGATFGSCTTDLSDELVSVESDIAQALHAHHATFVPTLQWFCANGKCPTVVGSTIAYLDRGHITPAYADQIAPALAAALDTALRR